MSGIAIAHLMESDALVYLHCYRLSGCAVGRVKSCIVTERAASPAHRPVPVWACEPGINHEFLQALPIEAPVISHESIVPFPVREIIRNPFHIRTLAE